MGRAMRAPMLTLMFFSSTTLLSLSMFLLMTLRLRQEEMVTSSMNKNATRITRTSHRSKEGLNCSVIFHEYSPRWIQGTRMGNSVDNWSSQEAAALIKSLPFALSTTSPDKDNTYLGLAISHPASKFRRTSDADVDKRSTRLWQVRLAYLAIYYHQHRHAITEASKRKEIQCKNLWRKHRIGPYDYECPDAKFLVVGLGKLGLGANMRSAAVKALLTGLATGRVVLFVNNVSAQLRKKTTGDMGPWALASCPRSDHQCFFLPMTPCVLTEEELEEAYILDKHEMRHMIKDGKHPEGHENDRVLLMHLKIAPQLKIPTPALERIREYAAMFISHLNEKDPRIAALDSALTQLSDPDERRAIGYNYAQSNTRIHHSLQFYAMRPKLDRSKSMRDILSKIRSRYSVRENVIGLPIRASDKCNHESDCLTFKQHIQALNSDQGNNDPSLDGSTIIFTTESRAIVEQKDAFLADEETKTDNFHLVENPYDVLPGTGYMEELAQTAGNTSADESMFSALVSLQLQLSANFTLANCCSNFHTLIGDFLIEGLGATHENTFHCLQEHQDPEFKICCGWHKDCKRKRKEYLLGRNVTTLR